MLFAYISLIYIAINFEAFLNGLVRLSTTSHDDLVDGVFKLFVAVPFFIYVVTTFLEGFEHLWKRQFVNQSAKQIVQPISQPVEEENPATADAITTFDVAEIKRELEREFNHQIELELELDLEHERRLELELEMEIEIKRKIKIDVVGAVTADSSECAISDADFLAEQQRVIQDALGDSSVQITWGDIGSASTTDTLAHFDVAGEVESALRSELELELELELILEEHDNSKCTAARKRQRQQHLGSRMYVLGNGR